MSTLQKALTLLTVLGILLPSAVSGVGFSSAQAQNIQAMTVVSGKYVLTAVSSSNSLNTQSALSLNATRSGVIFFVKNFGTKSIRSFSIDQQAVGSVNLRYCESGFGTNPASEICIDGSTSIFVALRNGTFNVLLANNLGANNTIEFKQDSRRTTLNTVSVSVSPQ